MYRPDQDEQRCYQVHVGMPSYMPKPPPPTAPHSGRQCQRRHLNSAPWASETPDEPRPIIESAPSPPLPQKAPESTLKRPTNEPKILCQNCLDTKIPFRYIQPTPKRIVNNTNAIQEKSFAFQKERRQNICR